MIALSERGYRLDFGGNEDEPWMQDTWAEDVMPLLIGEVRTRLQPKQNQPIAPAQTQAKQGARMPYGSEVGAAGDGMEAGKAGIQGEREADDEEAVGPGWFETAAVHQVESLYFSPLEGCEAVGKLSSCDVTRSDTQLPLPCGTCA